MGSGTHSFRTVPPPMDATTPLNPKARRQRAAAAALCRQTRRLAAASKGKQKAGTRKPQREINNDPPSFSVEKDQDPPLRKRNPPFRNLSNLPLKSSQIYLEKERAQIASQGCAWPEFVRAHRIRKRVVLPCSTGSKRGPFRSPLRNTKSRPLKETKPPL